MPTTTKRTALEAYMAAHADVLALIERIQVAIENHDTAPAPEDINWGDASSMTETAKSLKAISDRLFVEGEYAPEAR